MARPLREDSPARRRLAARRAFHTLCPRTDPETGHGVSATGETWPLSNEEAIDRLAQLPLGTLRTMVNEFPTMTDAGRRWLAIFAQWHAVPHSAITTADWYNPAVPRCLVSNIVAFAPILDALGQTRADSRVPEMDAALHLFETGAEGLDEHDPIKPGRTPIDYSTVTAERRADAAAFILCANLPTLGRLPRRGFDLRLLAYAREHLGKARLIARVAAERGTTDYNVIRDVVESETPVIADGVL